MATIGIGLVGTGYMGKAHAVALKSVGAVFNTSLRPVCEVICSTTEAGAPRARRPNTASMRRPAAGRSWSRTRVSRRS
ncbi:MAG: hypothetical protein ACHQIL_01325 [Steroidobacterales bacterium]